MDLQYLYNSLKKETELDHIDWQYLLKFSRKWKFSIVDALLDLNYINEIQLAKILSELHKTPYIASNEISIDYQAINLDNFDDLITVGAIPIKKFKLVICNPYDDHHGYLGNHFCEREMAITERSAIMANLRTKGLEYISNEMKLVDRKLF